ncbi:MAG: hypothetical protein FWG59_05675, partial [Betaproteobacteria bacterium]|nr:hypothetical protein [Betaproteobacteria bacterium]
ELGFSLLATSGTAKLLEAEGLEVEPVFKVYEGRPNIVDLIKNKEISLVVNTASGKLTAHDSKEIRRGALACGIPYCTTVAAARASARAIRSAREGVQVENLQGYYAKS